MSNSIDFSKLNKLFEKQIQEFKPIYANLEQYIKDRIEHTFEYEDLNDKINKKINKINLEDEIASLPKAIETARHVYDYFMEIEQVFIQKKLSELKKAKIPNLTPSELNEVMKKEIELIDEKIKSKKDNTKINDNRDLSYQSSTVTQINQMDLLTSIRFEKYKADCFLLLLQAKEIEDLKKEKVEKESSLNELKFNLTKTKEQLSQNSKKYNDIPNYLARTKLSYLEKLMTSEKTSAVGFIIKSLLRLIPRLSLSIKEKGERKINNFRELKVFREAYENTYNIFKRQIAEETVLEDNIAQLSKKITMMNIIHRKIDEMKEKLSKDVFLNLVQSVANVSSSDKINELEKDVLSELIRQNLGQVNVDIQRQKDINTKPKNEMFNMASLQVRIKEFENKFGQESLTTLTNTLTDLEKKLLEKIQKTDEKQLYEKLFLEYQTKKIETDYIENTLDYYQNMVNVNDTTQVSQSHVEIDGKKITNENEKEFRSNVDLLREELKQYENLFDCYKQPAKNTEMQRNSSHLKDVSKPSFTPSNNTYQKDKIDNEILSVKN